MGESEWKVLVMKKGIVCMYSQNTDVDGNV